jgi:hypothetical protein
LGATFIEAIPYDQVPFFLISVKRSFGFIRRYCSRQEALNNMGILAAKEKNNSVEEDPN